MTKLVLRYAFSREANHRSRVVRTMILLSLSTVIFLTTLSLMASLQDRRFSLIKDTRSFDITVHTEDVDTIRSLYPEASVFSYKEDIALVDGRPYRIRYIDESYDGGLEILAGNPDSLMVPYDLYVGLDEGSVNFATLSRTASRRIPINRDVEVSGIYYSRARADFDSMYVLSSLSNAPGELENLVAVKGVDDTRRLEKAGFTGFETWKEKERTLYSAFILESTMMALVISLLFIIVLISLSQMSRTILEAKKKERAGLMILGMSKARVDAVFLLSFLLVVTLSMLLGAVLSCFTIHYASLYLCMHYNTQFNALFPFSTFFSMFILMHLLTVMIVGSRLGRREVLMEVLRG